MDSDSGPPLHDTGLATDAMFQTGRRCEIVVAWRCHCADG